MADIISSNDNHFLLTICLPVLQELSIYQRWNLHGYLKVLMLTLHKCPPQKKHPHTPTHTQWITIWLVKFKAEMSTTNIHLLKFKIVRHL